MPAPIGKRSHHQALHVSFADGHWEFLGHDEEIKFSQARQDVLDLLSQKGLQKCRSD